ncbi:hypothetical protein [uncultured Aquimarina sp.]|uniref:hypothetical protein n=1 Tax=uncultured Aquimarina sp. TaxID=575652 RepID=UPI0026208669|nr:hypothetical protein [uncultured Aquimarina sp.]
MKTKTITLAVFLTLLSVSTSAQIERKDLYVIGKEFYENDNFKEAVVYLFAYREINLEYLKTNALEDLGKINAALDHCRENIRNESSITFMVTSDMQAAIPYNTTINIEGKMYKIQNLQPNVSAPLLIEQ